MPIIPLRLVAAFLPSFFEPNQSAYSAVDVSATHCLSEPVFNEDSTPYDSQCGCSLKRREMSSFRLGMLGETGRVVVVTRLDWNTNQRVQGWQRVGDLCQSVIISRRDLRFQSQLSRPRARLVVFESVDRCCRAPSSPKRMQTDAGEQTFYLFRGINTTYRQSWTVP